MPATAVADLTCAVFLAVICVQHLAERAASKSNKWLNTCLILMITTLAVEAAACIFKGTSYPLALRYVINLLTFTIGAVNVMCFTFYTEALIREKGGAATGLFHIARLGVLAWFIALVYEFVSGHLLTYTDGAENDDYSYRTYLIIIQFAVLVYLPVITLINHKRTGLKLALLMCLFCLVPILGAVLLILTGIDLTYAFSAVSLALIFEFIHQQVRKQAYDEQWGKLQDALKTANTATQRSAMLYKITDTSPWVYEISADDRVLSADYSDSLMRIVKAEYTGDVMGWVKLMHPEDRDRVFTAFMAAIYDHSGNTPYNEAFRTQGSDGKYHWVRSSGYVTRRADGTGEFFGSATDFTKQIEEEQQRRRQMELQDIELQKSRLRADSLAYIADHDPDLDDALDFFGKRILDISGCDQVIFREPDGHRVVFNAPGIVDVPREVCDQCPFAGFENDVYGEDGVILMNDCSQGFGGVKVHPCCPAKSSFMQRVYAGGKPAGLLTVHYLKQQHIFTDDGVDVMKTVASYLGILIDRIESGKMEQAKVMAEAESKAKTDFLFNMSHDIRTPMNAIIGFTDKALRHEGDAKVVDESLRKVKSSGEYLLRIINDILDMARIESGRLELKEELYFNDSGNNTLIDLFSADAARKDIKLHTACNTDDKYLWLDETRISQIVANLLSNAIKYTQPGGDIWYTVDQILCERPGYGRFRVTVRDNGCGMSPEFVARIFNEFERDKSAVKNGIQGTGLGMAIVKRLIDAMGGTIEVQSELGKGTAITYVTEHRIATDEEIEAFRRENGEIPDASAEKFRGKRILLAEDNELNMEIAVDLLEEKGFIVETASDGSIAADMMKAAAARQEHTYYDAILMDVQMPVMNGYEATKAIRAIPVPDGVHIPIIAMTANAFEEDRRNALAAGMDDHLAKPIDVKRLFETLAKYM